MSVSYSLNNVVGSAIVTLVTVAIAFASRGDVIFIIYTIMNYLDLNSTGSKSSNNTFQNTENKIQETNSSFGDVYFYVLLSVIVSYATFYALTGFLQWHFYIRQKDKPHEWKCQPTKFLTKENECHEFIMGSINMGIGGIASGIVTCYIINGGSSTLYYTVSDYGWLYLILSLPMTYVYQEATGYYAHRMYHIPWLYKRIHKWHHRYQAPTPFSATAMHPLEFLTYQCCLASPAFLFPIHIGVFLVLLSYVYYYGVLDHSGIKLEAVWPWQPSSMYHDNHHKYFHCNFGFNSKLFDWLHGTLRRKDRIYGEDIFGGKGKAKSAAD